MQKRINRRNFIKLAGTVPFILGQVCTPETADIAESVWNRTPLEDYPYPQTEIPRTEAGEYARRIDAIDYSGNLENLLGNTPANVSFDFPAEMVVSFTEYTNGYNCLYINGEFQTGGKPVYLYVATASNAFAYAKSLDRQESGFVLGRYNVGEELFKGNMTPGISGARVAGVREGEFGIIFNKTVNDYMFYINADKGPQGIPYNSKFIVKSLRIGKI